MPNVSSALFVARVLNQNLVNGKRILDVGSHDFNGSVSGLIRSWNPSEYIGVDLEAGPGVDVVCSAEQLVARFGAETFDIVICVEMLEHAERWQVCVENLKKVISPGGILVVTTRSLGYPCHGFPNDYWRYEVEDFKSIFADMKIEVLEKDPLDPGVFLAAKKIGDTQTATKSLLGIELFSIPINRRIAELPFNYTANSYYRKLALKQRIKRIAEKIFFGGGRLVNRALQLRVSTDPTPNG